MEWLGDSRASSMFPVPGEQHFSDVSAMPASHPIPQSTAPPPTSTIASLCQSQQRCVKHSVVSGWQLVEAQDQLLGLGLHGSESMEQERARTATSSAELSFTEREWQRKESMLGGQRPGHSPGPGAEGSHDVFDKSIINIQSKNFDLDQEKGKTFVQKYEQELRHFGMLRRWDDSQRFLSELPQLICEETANYLILWCFKLQAEEKGALMQQVAHQAVAMQFILEMASTSQQDPRGCFRQFFHKAKEGQEGYLDVFHTELEAFTQRVRDHTLKSRGDVAKDTEPHATSNLCHPDPKEVLESLPPELRSCFQRQDMQILQNVLSSMNPEVAEYHLKRCLEAGLWTIQGRQAMDDTSETDDLRMMETS